MDLDQLLMIIVFGTSIGVVLGMLGGGSILTVPVLVYFLQMDPHGLCCKKAVERTEGTLKSNPCPSDSKLRAASGLKCVLTPRA